MCSECARKKNIERAMFKPKNMPIIREIKQMGAQGWEAKDIAEALDRNRKFVQRVLDTPLPDNLQDGSLLKVVRASWYPVGICVEREFIENEFLARGAFDDKAILQNGAKRYRVVRRGLKQELEAV